jgi:type IV pilus assembly protein PilW
MTSTRAPGAPRGFTLIELMIASTISILVIGGGVALMLSQQRMYQRSAGERGLQETARIALGELSTTLRMAGFGVDPPLVLDFGFADNLTMTQAPRIAGVNVRTTAPRSYLCNTPVSCRDSIAGPDEIVFYSRSPIFAHALTSVASATSISISGPLNTPLYAGQILQLTCTSGNMYWGYVTVGAFVDRTAAVGPVAVTLSPGAGGNQLDFPFQQGLLGDANFSECFASGAAMVTKVDRYRYFVANYDAAGAVQPALTPGTRPCLMLDQGLSDASNAPAQPMLVAPDVEDLQLGYLYPIGAVQLVGFTPNTAIAVGAGGIDLAPGTGSPGFSTPLGDPARLNQHPANIRAVRVSVVVRSSAPDPNIPDTVIPAAGNRPELPGLPNFSRMRFDTTVMLPNLDSRSPYFPVLSSNNGVDLLNVGGG